MEPWLKRQQWLIGAQPRPGLIWREAHGGGPADPKVKIFREHDLKKTSTGTVNQGARSLSTSTGAVKRR